MSEQVLEISSRGQITIPKKIRKIFKDQFVTIKIVDNSIILTPLQTVDKFLDDLDNSHQDWKKNGGLTLDQYKQKYGF